MLFSGCTTSAFARRIAWRMARLALPGTVARCRGVPRPWRAYTQGPSIIPDGAGEESAELVDEGSPP